MTSPATIVSVVEGIGPNRPLRILMLGALALVVLVSAIYFGAVVYIPIAAAAIGFSYLFVRDARVRLASLLGMIVLLELKTTHGDAALVDYIAAALFTGGLLFTLIRKKLIQRIPLAPSPLFIPFSLFLLWGTCIGLVGVIGGTITFEQCYRELMLFVSPLFLLPIYYSEIIEEQHSPDRLLSWSMIGLWIVVFVASAIKIKQNIGEAFYLYEVGTARYDTSNGAVMMFAFLSLAMTMKGKRRLLLVGGFFISVVSLLLTFGRTAWIAGLLFLPVVLVLGNRDERRRGLSFTAMIVGIGALAVLFGYFTVPMIRIGVLFVGDKFFSAAHMKTDPSMFNRYVEWAHIIKAIRVFPVTGYGFGATYLDFDWLVGVARMTSYTHNAYLSVLFKTGVVGVILLFIPYIGFFVRGLQYCRSKVLTDKERAYLRVGIATMLNITIIGYTGNVFYQREMMLYIALYWAYCMGIERKIHLQRSAA